MKRVHSGWVGVSEGIVEAEGVGGGVGVFLGQGVGLGEAHAVEAARLEVEEVKPPLAVELLAAELAALNVASAALAHEDAERIHI